MPEPVDDPREETLDQMLEGGPRSESWRVWREALERRLADLVKQKEGLSDPTSLAEVDEKIAEMEAQINALATEEIISEFVESEVDLILNTAVEDEEFG